MFALANFYRDCRRHHSQRELWIQNNHGRKETQSKNRVCKKRPCKWGSKKKNCREKQRKGKKEKEIVIMIFISWPFVFASIFVIFKFSTAMPPHELLFLFLFHAIDFIILIIFLSLMFFIIAIAYYGFLLCPLFHQLICLFSHMQMLFDGVLIISSLLFTPPVWLLALIESW